MAKTTEHQYEDVSADLEAWFRAEPGAVIEGKLLEFRDIETKFGEKILYIVQTSAECMAVPGGADAKDAEPEVFPAGTNIGVLSSGGMNGMKRIRVGTQLRLECTGTKDIGRGNDMKTFRLQRDVSCLGRGPCYLEAVNKRDNGAPLDDDIGF